MMVQTKDGYKKISEVTNKDKVLTHLGKWENVVTPTRRWYKDVMYNLKVEGCFNEIKCTKNHLFPTVQKKHGYVTNKIIWKSRRFTRRR